MRTAAGFSAAAVLLAAVLAADTAAAQTYPAKPIRIIVPLTPGSGADIAGRIVAKHLSDAFKQPVLVENRPGAGAIIGTQAMLAAEADGYTLMVQSASHAAKWARAGTPAAVVQKLNAQVNAIVRGWEVSEQFGRIGIAAAPMKTDEFARFVREQMGTFRKIAREANIPQQ